MNKNTPTVTVKSAYHALDAAGFPKSFVSRLLPDWWDNALFKTSSGAIEFASILKQRLGVDVRFAENGELEVLATDGRARYKKRATTQNRELQACSTLGVALGKLALFCMPVVKPNLPKDPAQAVGQVRALSKSNAITFASLLDFCWSQGVPVLFLKDLPRGSKRIAGMALQTERRPVIVLGFQSSQNARQLFILAHELAHICLGHVEKNEALIDECIDAITDSIEGETSGPSDDEERQADVFALALLRNGADNLPLGKGRFFSPAELAAEAVRMGQRLQVDPGHIILTYARDYNDWLMANQALGYFPDQSNAVALIKQRFISNCNVNNLSDDNRNYLLSMQGF